MVCLGVSASTNPGTPTVKAAASEQVAFEHGFFYVHNPKVETKAANTDFVTNSLATAARFR